jgi:hypothetical protein
MLTLSFFAFGSKAGRAPAHCDAVFLGATICIARDEQLTYTHLAALRP